MRRHRQNATKQCNILKNTATYRHTPENGIAAAISNMQRLTATHCNMPQHTAALCSTL